jgi:hypothetical protein
VSYFLADRDITEPRWPPLRSTLETRALPRWCDVPTGRLDTQFSARGRQLRPVTMGLSDQLDHRLAIGGADHSASSLHQIASAFFLKISNAAVFAKVLYLRRSSRANC